MNKVVVGLIFGIFMVLFLIMGSLVYFAFIHEPQIDKPVVDKPDVAGINTSQSLSNVEIKSEYITYILTEIGAYKLSNPPLSSKTPKIIVDVEGTLFYAEVVDNKITTTKTSFTDTDLKFITTKKVVIDTINSEDIGGNFKDSINSGETDFEMIASEKTLFLKGYLDLYEELTGEEVSITGGVIKVTSGRISVG